MDDKNLEEQDANKNVKPLTADEAKHELKKAIRGSEEILFSATTVWPFTFFPDTITIDRTKLTISRRKFIQVAEVMSIAIEDILNVTALTGPFFGSLRITHRLINQDKPYHLKWVWRQDAEKLKRILQGYIIAQERKIDCTSLKTSELADMLDKLGFDHPKTA